MSLETLDGDVVGLADHLGRIVVVHFFATWCVPCREELSALDRIARRYHGRAFSILAIDSGEPEARIRRFFHEFPVSFPILLDADRATLKAWGVTTFPTSFIVGSDGQQLWKVEGDVAWDSDSVAGVIEAEIDSSSGSSARSPGVVERAKAEEGEVQ